MPAGFDAAFAKVKQLVADFRANEKFYLSPAYQEQEARHDFEQFMVLDCRGCRPYTNSFS